MNRRFVHRIDILDSLIGDLDNQETNHLLITGDLTHIGTAIECEQVSDWLASIGSADDVSVIPGNHDCYATDDWRQTTDRWLDYMRSDTPAAIQSSREIYPSYRQRGPVAVIGLSTAIPTAPFFATGRLGERQIEKLGELLQRAATQGLFRIVALHHGPLADSNTFRKRLMDAGKFRSLINRFGAELILHGHGHYPVTGWLDSTDSKIPVVGAASASLLSSSSRKRAGYNIYDVKTTDCGWTVSMQFRRYDTDKMAFSCIDKIDVHLHRAASATA